MSYKWRGALNPTGSLIINARDYDKNYSQFTQVINGGMDRDNIPINSITHEMFENYSVGQTGIVSNINCEDDYTTYQDTNFAGGVNNPRGNTIRGLKYENNPVFQGDFWFQIGTTLNMPCEEGMATIRFHINSFVPKYYHYYIVGTTNRVAFKWRQFKIEVDGVEVSRTAAIFPTFHTTQIHCDVPISKGNHEFKIYCRVPGLINDTSNQVILQYWGGQLSVHNRSR